MSRQTHYRAYYAMGRDALLARLRDNTAQAAAQPLRRRTADARRVLCHAQVDALCASGPRYVVFRPSRRDVCDDIGIALGISPAIAAAVFEVIHYLESPSSEWAAALVTDIAPGGDTAGLAQAYALQLAATFDNPDQTVRRQATLARLVDEARDDDLQALPDLMAPSATEHCRVRRLSGRDSYLAAYGEVGRALQRVLATTHTAVAIAQGGLAHV